MSSAKSPGAGLGNEKYGAAEEIKKFAVVLNSSSVLDKLEGVIKIVEGPLKICREKLQVLESDEASVVLAKIDPGYNSELVLNLEEIYSEEVEKGKLLLEDIDTTLSELQTLLESTKNKLEDEQKQNSPNLSPPLVTDCFEDCRSVLIFLKLKTNIIKSYLDVPYDENVNPNPFHHCQSTFLIDEENFVYLLSKLNAVAVDSS